MPPLSAEDNLLRNLALECSPSLRFSVWWCGAQSLALLKKELAQAQRRAGSAIEAKSRTEAEGRRALEDMVNPSEVFGIL